MANKVYIATSLDGYIADKNHNLDWLSIVPMNDDTMKEFTSFMDTIDALVMGRNTFEKILSFNQWPYEKIVFIASNTLTSIPKEYQHKAQLIKGTPSQIINKLSDKGYRDLYIDGGKTIQNFLDENLIDELIITTIPILLGDGISLFGEMKKSIEFELVETKTLANSAVQIKYRRK